MTAQISHSVVVAGAPGSALGPHNAWQTVVSGGNAEQASARPFRPADRFPRSADRLKLLPFRPSPALVAQLDRASDYGSEGWGFESLQARK